MHFNRKRYLVNADSQKHTTIFVVFSHKYEIHKIIDLHESKLKNH